MYKIPVSKPSIGEKELAYATDAIKSGWVSSKGPYIEKFEQAWADYNGYKYGVSCNSGTNAIFLALKALGIKEGDEVIVPQFTMVATAWAVTYCGATPVFVPPKEDMTIDTEMIEKYITPKTRAIIPVHIYGRQCNMDAIMKIAHDYNLFVVEDSAEAHGIKPVGDVACFSFFGNKIITTGEGGMCVTNDKRLYEQMQHLKSMAFDTEHTFLHKKLGYNMRMTNVQAAIGLAQVERIDELLSKRRQVESWYLENTKRNRKYIMHDRNVVWVMDWKTDRPHALKKYLEGQGIETRLFFKPMKDQPMYIDGRYELEIYDYPTGIYLPLFPDMTKEEVLHVCKCLHDFYNM